MLSEDPLSLQIQLLPSNQYHLYLSVDKRMGRLIASVLPLIASNGMYAPTVFINKLCGIHSMHCFYTS